MGQNPNQSEEDLVMNELSLTHLGQSGFRLGVGDIVAYIDPYLSDFVEEREGPSMRRLRPAPFGPSHVTDADWVLLSHAHADHCDPKTLGPIAQNCPGARFLAPREVLDKLKGELGIAASRLVLAAEEPVALSACCIVRPVPAAHRAIEPDGAGGWRCVGFLIECNDKRVYHSGDTSVDPAIVAALRTYDGIDLALLPVNECNYYRDRAGIVANMSIREAFGFATEIGARTMVPMHYDMFAPNCVYEEEIMAVYRGDSPEFHLLLPGDCRGRTSCW
jgi:L-ascorbate metabolism protein UlaG (beta-lactamase superfamily)